MNQMNSRDNSSLKDTDLNFIEAEVFISFEVFIAIFAFTNNSLVLTALYRFPAMRSATNCYVASLAVADIAVALFAIPSAIVLRLGLSVHHDECDTVEGPSVGEGLCFVLITSVLFLTQVSIYSLLLIAIDKFVAIHYPYKYSRFMTLTKTRIAILSAWVLSGLAIVPPLLSWSQWNKISSECMRDKCRFEEIVSKEYMVYVNFFGCVLLPLIAMCVMYFLIFWSAKKQLVKIYSDVTARKRKKRLYQAYQRTTQTASKQPPCGSKITEDSSSVDASSSCFLNDTLDTETCDRLRSDNCLKTPTVSTAKAKNPSNIDKTTPSDDAQRDRKTAARKRALLRRELHAAKSLATVVGVFAFCWLPLHLLHASTFFCKDCREPYMILDITILLSHANSLINPIIYAYRMRDFRNAFSKLFPQAPFQLLSKVSCFRKPSVTEPEI